MATSVNLGRVVGYSAYEIAVQNGYEGTEEQWLNSLKGADGAPGATGPAGETGPAGADGADGSDGFSPVATVARNQADDGVVISITDANGTTSATVYDGADGSGGIPTDPDEEYTNVLSGAGIWVNAWEVARQGAYGRTEIITEDNEVLITPDWITVQKSWFPSYWLDGDTINISLTFRQEGGGAGGDGFPLDKVGYDSSTNTYTFSDGSNITMTFQQLQDFSWEIRFRNTDWTYTGIDYLCGLAVEHDNFADAVNEVVGDSGSAPTYTAGTGIDITNNVISSTVVVPTATSDLTNDSGFITSSALSGYAQTADLATVATTGDYTDLSNTPTIPTVPTNVSSFTNDAGYITASQVPNELPSYSGASEGDVLTVDSRGELNWATPSSGGSGITEEDLKTGITVEMDHESGEEYSALSVGIDEGGVIVRDYDDSDREVFYAGLSENSQTEYDDTENTKTQTWLNYGIADINFYKTVIDTSQDPEETTDEYSITLQPNADYDGFEFVVNGDTYTLATIDDIPRDELPSISSGDAGKVLKVNSGETGVEWATIPAAPSIATAQTAGLVKPDGTTITVDANGTISAASSGGLSQDSRDNLILHSNTQNQNSVASGVTKYDNAVFGTGNSINGSGYCSANFVSGSNNVVQGSNNIVSGSGNHLYENQNMQAPMNCVAVGSGNLIYGTRHSAVIGQGLETRGWSNLIIGNYNYNKTDAFVIGNGSDSSNKSDALVVTSAGNATFSGTVAASAFTDLRGDPIGGGGVTFPIESSSGSEADGEIVNITIDTTDGLMLERAVYQPDDPEAVDPVYDQTELLSSAFDSGGLIFVSEDGQGNREEAQVYSSGMSFSNRTQEPDPEDESGETTIEVFKEANWDMNGIELVDQSTGDVYRLSIYNGQISLTNISV